MKLPTVRIKRGDTVCLINECDFDPDEHELYQEETENTESEETEVASTPKATSPKATTKRPVVRKRASAKK